MVLFTKHHSTFMSSETISENKLASIASIKASNDVDLVRSYLRDIGRVPLLSHEQEITLGRQVQEYMDCLLYTSPSPRDVCSSRMPSSA